jgi:hypothetical protein
LPCFIADTNGFGRDDDDADETGFGAGIVGVAVLSEVRAEKE